MKHCPRCKAHWCNGTICPYCNVELAGGSGPIVSPPLIKGCEEAVIEKIRQRREAGRKKYGTTMERKDLEQRDWLRHAQEEAMDLAIYLERLIQDLEHPSSSTIDTAPRA